MLTNLIANTFFKYFGNGRYDRNLSIIIGVITFALSENGSDFCQFPLVWKDTSLNRLLKISVRDGETMLTAILKSLFGIISNPADFLSFS